MLHAGLLLGVGSELMVEYHISAFLPQLGDRPVSDLFTADTFGPAPAQAGTRRLADPSKRSNMKRANQHGESQRLVLHQSSTTLVFLDITCRFLHCLLLCSPWWSGTSRPPTGPEAAALRR
jgi:hypothetical protein